MCGVKLFFSPAILFGDECDIYLLIPVPGMLHKSTLQTTFKLANNISSPSAAVYAPSIRYAGKKENINKIKRIKRKTPFEKTKITKKNPPKKQQFKVLKPYLLLFPLPFFATRFFPHEVLTPPAFQSLSKASLTDISSLLTSGCCFVTCLHQYLCDQLPPRDMSPDKD